MALSNEVTRFKQWLRDKGTTEDVLKVCAVVEGNLGEIAQTTHAGGKRTRVITPMIREGMAQPLPEDAPVAAGDPADIGWDRLTRLEVGPFRGFRRQEVFDLGHPTVLILGANGTGKSSLCEAIELALLGRIEEADERALEPRRYLDNAHEGRHERPVLMARLNGNDQELHPDEERHRFVIVERNRIESFARIGARKPAEATGMLAALFGLSDFHDFVSGFGASLDTRLRLTLPKAAELEQKRAAIQADQAKIASVEDTHAALDLQRQQVAEAFEAGLTYADLKARIGTPEAPGRLQAIRAVLAVPLPPASGIRPDRLVALRREERDSARQLKQARAALAARAQEVSYRSLYQSIAALEASQPDRCPACETPLDQVAVNPFSRANAGLQALRELAELEGEANRLERQVDRQQGQIEAAVHQAVEHAGTLPEPERLAPMDQALGAYGRRGWRRLLIAARALQKRDDGLAAERIEREAMDAEANRLDLASTRLATLDGQQRQFDTDVMGARERVAAFDAQTAPLAAEVAAEAADHQVEVRIKEAYEAFYASLREYLAGLPERLMADLNEVVVDLYNGFNVQDHPNDLIHELRLPLIGGRPMEVRFKGAPDRWHNALALLSEGHLRCLGLAILLAKNIKLGLPVVLLDDAVNAIDHDHREGIRTTLFGHPALKNKQVIVTCHSPEFIKDIFNNHTKNAPLYVLRHHKGDHHPVVSGGQTRNYIERAEGHVADFDSRAALACSRQALENLAARMWKKLANDFPNIGTLSLPLRRPDAPPDLSNIVQSLLAGLNQGIKANTLGEPWITRRDHLDAILKAKENSLAWMSLNKGTHEEVDREDFEEPTLRRILDGLKGIESTFHN